jgi:rhodanese-related sulfurtransferase
MTNPAVVLVHYLLWLIGFGAWVRPMPGPNPLACLEAHVASRFQVIAHIVPQAVSERLVCAGARVIMFDVRSYAEYGAGHISGAVHVEPDIGAKEFHREYGERVRGQDCVFYCAVGLRSSRLAERLNAGLAAAGARSVINLSGGIFRWRNESRPLVAQGDDPPRLHPYSKYWTRFLLTCD